MVAIYSVSPTAQRLFYFMAKLFIQSAQNPQGLEVATIADNYAGQWTTAKYARLLARQCNGLDGGRLWLEEKEAVTAWLKRNNVDTSNPLALAKALFFYCKTCGIYQLDAQDGNEYLQTPEWTKARGIYDCEDAASLTATVFGFFDFPVSFILAQYNEGISRFEHIYSVALVDGKPLALDITLRRAELGATFKKPLYAAQLGVFDDHARLGGSQLGGWLSTLGKFAKAAAPVGIVGVTTFLQYRASNTAAREATRQAEFQAQTAQAQALAAQAAAAVSVQRQAASGNFFENISPATLVVGGVGLALGVSLLSGKS